MASLACAVVAGCVSSSKKTAPATTTTPVKRAAARGVSQQQLVTLSGSLGHAIYWAGPESGKKYELSKTTDGRVYVRYLPPEVSVGDPHAKYLTVGTYPHANATSVLQSAAKAQGKQLIILRGGGIGYVPKGHPTSVYVAYPGSNYQIEVFDPNPSTARSFATGGKIVPVGIATTGRASAKAVSAAQLHSFATAAGHPLYWAGAAPGMTYEFTQTSDGRMYVRYLPSGVQVGDTRPNYLTIGTYPQTSAVATLKATAESLGGNVIKLPGGAVAWVEPKSPTSVYVAQTGGDVLVEVYDPVASKARQVATSDQLSAVG